MRHAQSLNTPLAEIAAHRDDDDERQHDAKRRRGLQPARIIAAALIRDVLGHIGDGAAILAAEAQPLNHPQAEQDDGGGHPDLVEGRDQADRAGAERHAGQRDEEGVFAADPIAHPAEHEGAQRTNQEAGGEQRDGAQQRRDRMRLFEEFHRQDRGEAAENVEVVPLDDVAARRGGDHASKVRRNVSGHGHLLGPPRIAMRSVRTCNLPPPALFSLLFP